MADEVHVLIVDDEPRICEFLEMLLQREGYLPRSVHRAADALAAVEKARFDLVLTDLKMPGMDGFELVTRLKATCPELPIIMITGYATVETAVQALRFGVEDYVTKPFNIDELRKVISRALQSARLGRENQELVGRLQHANAELERHRRLLSEKVRKTGSELEAARESLDRHRGQVEVFSHVSELAAGEVDLSRMLTRLVTALNERLGARSCSAMLREGDELVVRAAEGEGAAELLGRREPWNEGLTGRVALHQQPLLVRNAEVDALFPAGGPTGGSYLCVPIVHHSRTLGVINVCDRRSGGAFDQRDMETVTAAANQVAPAIENAALYRALEDRCVSVINALVTSLEAKDRYTSGHSRRVSEYACALARAAGASPQDVEILHKAAHLHDIGKIAVSEQILDKPRALNDEERTLIRRHPETGETIIEPLDFLRAARPLIRHHHECMDGSGYPDHLQGEQIPRLARMLAIADAFDAMTSERPYRPAMTMDGAAAELKASAGRQFDANLAQVFCAQVLTRY